MKKRFVVVAVALTLSASIVPLAAAQNNNQAEAKFTSDDIHFHPGSEIAIRVTLNDPLPQDAHLTANFSHQQPYQAVSGQSGESADKDRREFVITTKLPDNALPGQWKVDSISLTIEKPVTASQYLGMNAQPMFIVDGKEQKLPTTATATILSK